MKPSLIYPILCSAWLALGHSASLAADERYATKPARMTREDTALVTVTASVEAIDVAKREVTLKGPLGNTVTFTVDPKVKRLDEVKVGDLIRAEYYISIAAELRKPTAKEEKTPFVLLDAAAKAPPGASPAASGLRRFKVVTTIEGLDRPAQTVTVKGPRGNYLTVRVADPSRLTQMRIGEHVIITYTEALAIGLEKLERKNLD